MENKQTYFKPWVIFIICSNALTGLPLLFIGLICGALKVDESLIINLTKVGAPILGTVVSYFMYVWSVKKFILDKSP